MAVTPFSSAQTTQTAPTPGTASESGTSAGATTTGNATTTGTSPELQTFLAQRKALAGQLTALMAQGATPQQIQAWHQQNAARFASLQQMAQAIAASQPAKPIAYITEVALPANASQAMQDFLTAQANLFNVSAQIHNQQLQASGTINSAAANAMFRQQNAAALQGQVQRAQVLAQEAGQQPMAMPPPLVLPPNATTNQKAFLTLRDHLMRAQIQLHDQNLQADAPTRQAALAAWRQANQSQLQQLQALAQNLSQTSN